MATPRRCDPGRSIAAFPRRYSISRSGGAGMSERVAGSGRAASGRGGVNLK